MTETVPPESVRSTTGVVTRIDAKVCHVEIEGKTVVCSLRGAMFKEEGRFASPIAVGDKIVVAHTEGGGAAVERILARSNWLSRPGSYRQKEQLIVANVHQVVVIGSVSEPPFNARLVDRILVAAERAEAAILIVLNKIDLAEDRKSAAALLEGYAAIGYATLLTSATGGEGVSSLRAALSGKTTVLAGSSGVGKSALLTAVEPGLRLRSAAVSNATSKGRHTTTAVSLLPLSGGGFVVDTPGMREFGIAGLLPEDVGVFFRDISQHVDACRLRNCLHLHEPSCAVRDAVEKGVIAAARYDSYVRIVESMLEERRKSR
jgi:ribosome biogenesis GTPase